MNVNKTNSGKSGKTKEDTISFFNINPIKVKLFHDLPDDSIQISTEKTNVQLFKAEKYKEIFLNGIEEENDNYPIFILYKNGNSMKRLSNKLKNPIHEFNVNFNETNFSQPSSKQKEKSNIEDSIFNMDLSINSTLKVVPLYN